MDPYREASENPKGFARADGRSEELLMKRTKGMTRRKLLGSGVAAVAAGATLLAGPQQAPTVVTRRRFRAWISRGDGQGRTSLQEVTLRPITGRQVLVRTEATNLCYSNTPAVLGQPQPQGTGAAPATTVCTRAPNRNAPDE